MKLRVRGDSLRYRLTQTEVTTLCEGGSHEDSTLLGPGSGSRLTYRIETADVDRPTVKFSSGADTIITVVLPKTAASHWSETAEVGIYFDEAWGLKVAVEKDFRCLDPERDEDESDNFENPLASQGHQPACSQES